MKALMWKEMRELFPAWVLLLASTVMMGFVDLAYNWHQKHMVGLSVWYCLIIAFVAALAGGANTLARESTRTLSFLGALPVRRGQVWAAKALVALAALISLIALSFGACIGLLALHGYYPTQYGPLGPPAFSADWLYSSLVVLGILFTFGLALSAQVRSAMGAALGAVMVGGAFATGVYYLRTEYLPGRWGPWLGISPYDPVALPAWELALLVLGFGVLAVGASGWSFMRTPVLETARRWKWSGKLFGVLAAASIMLPLLTLLLAPCPRPDRLAWADLDPTGHWLALSGKAANSGLWMMDVEGRNWHCVSRGPTEIAGWLGPGQHLMFDWGSESTGNARWQWLAEPQGRRWRLTSGRQRNWNFGFVGLSPSGNYSLIRTGNDLAMTKHGREVLRLPWGDPCGWSPDESTLYVTRTEWPTPPKSSGPVTLAKPASPPPTTTLYAVTMAGGGQKTLYKFMGSGSEALSPDGRWMAIQYSFEKLTAGGEHRVHSLAVLDIRKGVLHTLPGWRAAGYPPWSPDGRYLWCTDPYRTQSYSDLHVIDMTTLTEVATITSKQLGGIGPQWVRFSPRGDLALLTGATREEADQGQNPYLFTIRPNGADLKRLGELKYRRGERVLGWTWDGEVLIFDAGSKGTRPSSLTRLNPQTGARRGIYSPGG